MRSIIQGIPAGEAMPITHPGTEGPELPTDAEQWASAATVDIWRRWSFWTGVKVWPATQPMQLFGRTVSAAPYLD